LVLTLCWVGAYVNRIQNAINPDHGVVGLEVWEYQLNTLQGFLNACVFALVLNFQKKQDSTESYLTTPAEYQRLLEY